MSPNEKISPFLKISKLSQTSLTNLISCVAIIWVVFIFFIISLNSRVDAGSKLEVGSSNISIFGELTKAVAKQTFFFHHNLNDMVVFLHNLKV